jgi:hypothetical protein
MSGTALRRDPLFADRQTRFTHPALKVRPGLRVEPG